MIAGGFAERRWGGGAKYTSITLPQVTARFIITREVHLHFFSLTTFNGAILTARKGREDDS